jgi:hypothetical protein
MYLIEGNKVYEAKYENDTYLYDVTGRSHKRIMYNTGELIPIKRVSELFSLIIDDFRSVLNSDIYALTSVENGSCINIHITFRGNELYAIISNNITFKRRLYADWRLCVIDFADYNASDILSYCNSKSIGYR